jgi:hypothetical protein
MGAPTTPVTRNEICCSLNKPDDFILAIVEFTGDDDTHRVNFLCRPFPAPGMSLIASQEGVPAQVGERPLSGHAIVFNFKVVRFAFLRASDSMNRANCVLLSNHFKGKEK